MKLVLQNRSELTEQYAWYTYSTLSDQDKHEFMTLWEETLSDRDKIKKLKKDMEYMNEPNFKEIRDRQELIPVLRRELEVFNDKELLEYLERETPHIAKNAIVTYEKRKWFFGLF